MTFADKLRTLRDAKGMTQRDLAQAGSVPIGTVRDYEQGRRMPSLESAVKLAAALGTDCRAFADCVKVPGKPATAPRKLAKKKPHAAGKRERLDTQPGGVHEA